MNNNVSIDERTGQLTPHMIIQNFHQLAIAIELAS